MKRWKQSILSALVCVALLYFSGEVKASDFVFVDGPYMVIDLSGGHEAEAYPVTYVKNAQDIPGGITNDLYKTTSLLMRRVPAGTFTMGSPVGELGSRVEKGAHAGDKEAQREVTLTKDFYIGVFQVTQKQWERVMGDWPSYFNNTAYRDSRPLEQRSWDDIRGGSWPGGQPSAGTFMQRISTRTGLPFDLPTETQWEYACRAGTETALNSGKNLTNIERQCLNLSEVARYYYNNPEGLFSIHPATRESMNTDGGTAKVGSYRPNAWGLYDMHGNVWELCLDWYAILPPSTSDPVGPDSGVLRVNRGGGWSTRNAGCRSATRSMASPSNRLNYYGFRLSLTFP